MSLSEKQHNCHLVLAARPQWALCTWNDRNLPLACGFAQQRSCTLPDAAIKKVGGWVHPSLGMMEELKGLRKLRVFASELLRPGYLSWIKDGKTKVGSMDGEKLKGLMVVLRQRDHKLVASLQMQ